MKIFIFLVIALISTPAEADWFYRLIGYECDHKSNRLIISYRGMYNEAGEEMVKNKKPNEWEPGALIESMKDDDHIGELTTINAECKLKRNTYSIKLGPSPGNFNIQGRCGAEITAWAEVLHKGKAILPIHEMEGDCHDDDYPVTTTIIIRDGAKNPEFKKIQKLKFQGF